jgi:peptide deformylase
LKPQQKAKELFDKFMFNQYTNFKSERLAWKSVDMVADTVLHEIDQELQGFLDADRVAYWEQIKKIANDSQG